MATRRELRGHIGARVALILGAALADSLVFFAMVLAIDRMRSFETRLSREAADGNWLSDHLPLMALVLCATTFFWSFVSTMHRGLTEWDRRGPEARRSATALIGLATAFALADVVWWPLAFIVAGPIAGWFGLYQDYGSNVGWAAAWLITRVWLGAPESCTLHRKCGWWAAVRVSSTLGPDRWVMIVPHALTTGIGLSAMFGVGGRHIGYMAFFFLVLQVTVSLDAAATTAWYRLHSQEQSKASLAQVFE